MRFIFLLLALVFAEFVSAQDDSTKSPSKDTGTVADSPVIVPRDTLPKRKPVVHHDSATMVTVDTITRLDENVVPAQDSSDVTTLTDSVSRKPFSHLNWPIDPNLPLSFQLIKHHPYFAFDSAPVIIHSDLKLFRGKETIFYALIGLLLTFSFLRQAFPKYFNDLFRLLFRTTIKQKQIREQLMQTPLPSLLLNALFVLTGGMYVALLLQHFDEMPIKNFWLLSMYCSLGLTIMYTVKFFGLKVAGWLFNISAVADAYIFVVFIINKVIGIFLLPFLVLLSFVEGNIYTVALVMSWCGIGILLVYRLMLTYASIRNQVRFNPFHFLLYLCAFEIAPLLLVYKALLFFFR